MELFEQYKNNDGTYLSPRNNKTYKSLKAFRSHWFYVSTVNSKTFKERLYNVECQHCQTQINVCNIKRHEIHCYLNPDNLMFCKVCNNPIKNYQSSKGTCSVGCSNTYFRSGKNNGMYKKGCNYRTECFLYHDKKCIVCGEEKIVAVHHYDRNHDNNDPSNLIPLCPTHHQYVHSRYVDEVMPIIEKFIEDYRA